MSFVTLTACTKGCIMTMDLNSRSFTQLMCIKFKQSHLLWRQSSTVQEWENFEEEKIIYCFPVLRLKC